MSSLPWSQFYWADWERDPGLRMCSYAAKGLWMDMLCRMDASTERGFLLAGDRAATNAEIAKMVGGERRTVERLIGELEAQRVLSRDGRAAIYSRRMCRDAAISRRNAENGKLGGNPQLANNNDLEKKAVNPPVKRVSQANGTRGVGKSVKPDTDTESEKKDSVLRTGKDAALDPQKILWNEGLATIRVLTNSDAGPARKLLGKLVNLAGAHHAELLALVRRAEIEQPDNPHAWLLAGATGLNGHAAQSLPFPDALPPGVTTEARTGRLVAGGLYLEEVADAACEAAGIPTTEARRHWSAVVGWAEAEKSKFDIVTAIRRVAERPGYTPPGTLKFFDRAVREQRSAP